MTLPWVSEILDLSNAENLPPAGHPFFEGSFSPMGTLALFSPAYAPSQPDWPVNTCTTGFCFYDSVGYLGQHEADWQAFTAAGPRPLVFTLGSAAAFRGQKFYEQARRYSKKLQHRAILLTAVPSSLAPGTDPDILETDYAPYSELFPLANILVHQGGIGTTAQALRSGVPQVVVPFAHDQPDNAARLRRLGVAVTTSRATFESGLAGRTLRRLLSRPDIFRNKAQQLAVRIREENGPANACAFLEQF